MTTTNEGKKTRRIAIDTSTDTGPDRSAKGGGAVPQEASPAVVLPAVACTSCKAEYTEETFAALDRVASGKLTQEIEATETEPAESLRLRNCKCGSTIAVRTVPPQYQIHHFTAGSASACVWRSEFMPGNETEAYQSVLSGHVTGDARWAVTETGKFMFGISTAGMRCKTLEALGLPKVHDVVAISGATTIRKSVNVSELPAAKRRAPKKAKAIAAELVTAAKGDTSHPTEAEMEAAVATEVLARVNAKRPKTPQVPALLGVTPLGITPKEQAAALLAQPKVAAKVAKEMAKAGMAVVSALDLEAPFSFALTSAGTDPKRPSVHGIGGNGRGTVCGTDGHRMHLAQLPKAVAALWEKEADAGRTLDAEGLETLISVFNSNRVAVDAPVTVQRDTVESKLGMVDGLRFTAEKCRPIFVRFSDPGAPRFASWQSAIPTGEVEATVKVTAASLLSALEAVEASARALKGFKRGQQVVVELRVADGECWAQVGSVHFSDEVGADVATGLVKVSAAQAKKEGGKLAAQVKAQKAAQAEAAALAAKTRVLVIRDAGVTGSAVVGFNARLLEESIDWAGGIATVELRGAYGAATVFTDERHGQRAIVMPVRL